MPITVDFKGQQRPKELTPDYLAELKIRTLRFDAGLDPEPPVIATEEAFQTTAFQANAVQ